MKPRAKPTGKSPAGAPSAAPTFADAGLSAQAAAVSATLAPDEYETSIKAVVRVRPYKSGDGSPCIEHVPSEGPESLLRIVSNPSSKSSRRAEADTIKNFDDIFWSINPPPAGIPRAARNRDIFERIGIPVLDKAFRGMNSTVFAYGQTGSGKSFTMGLGEGIPEDDPGLIPSIVRELYDRIASGRTSSTPAANDNDAALAAGMTREYEVRCSFMEVFNDHQNGGMVRDLNPYDLFSQDQAKALRKAYVKVVEGDATAQPGATMEQVKDMLRKSFPKAEDDELSTRAAMLYDYRAMDRKLRPQVFNAQLPESGHGGLIKGVRGKEVGLLAAKKDDLGEDNGHYYPKGLAERRCRSWDDVQSLVVSGTSRRKSHATDFNEHSSRSHAIVQLRLDTYLVSDEGKERIKDMTALINLVDLAGSERFDKAGTLSSGRAAETQGINTSLEYLGRVLKGMAKGGRTGDVVGALRMVCLTRLLASSIGGNSETWMVACVNPSLSEWEETVSTLAYAHLAREIKQVVRQNKTGLSDAKLVIAKLMAQLENMQGEESERVASMRAELGRLQRMKDQMESDRERERVELQKERDRRAAIERQREEQREHFEGTLSTLAERAAAQDAEYEAVQRSLEEQAKARSEAEALLKERVQQHEALAEKQRAILQEKMDDIQRTAADKREQEAQLMQLKTADERERLAREQELSKSTVELEVLRKREEMLGDQLKALKAGDEERLRQIAELQEQLEAAAKETDAVRQREELLATEYKSMADKLASVKRRREELREASRGLEEQLRQQLKEVEEYEDRISEREYEIARRSREIATRAKELDEKEELLAAREAAMLDKQEQLECVEMELEQAEAEDERITEETMRLQEVMMGSMH